MRVLLLINSLYTGGAEFSSLNLYGWLLKKGYTVKLIVLKEVSPSYDPRTFGFSEIQVLSDGGPIQRYRRLKSIIQDFKPTIVHSVLFEANLLGRLCRILLGGFKHIESLINEMYSENRYTDPQVTRFKLQGYRLLDFTTQIFGVDHYHANGESVAKHYQDKLRINPKRITVIPRGRASNPFAGDAQNREKIRAEFSVGDKLLVINVARHEYQKAQDVLIDAVAQLGRLKDQIKVLLVGREGKLTQVIRDKIKQYDLAEMVMLAGHRNDVQALLAASDVFVFPSRFEGLSGALIEAEAAGLPIVCSDIDNNHEVAVKGKNSLFFPVNDASALAAQIIQLIENDELRKRMGQESLTCFQEKFSLDKSHNSMLNLLEKLMESNK